MQTQTAFAPRSLSILLIMLLATSALSTRLIADEGMFPMSELGKLDLKAKGIELTAEELFNPKGLSLVDGVCRVNGCTGSFVSKSGLIITNHHCAYDAIQKASTPKNDLLASGFKVLLLLRRWRRSAHIRVGIVGSGCQAKPRTGRVLSRCIQLDLLYRARPSATCSV